MTIDYKATLAQALSKQVQAAQALGCCRVYVTFTDEHAKSVAKAAKALNKVFQKRAHYGYRNALYVGYDNCDGNAIARAGEIVNEFAKQGVQALIEFAED